MDNSEDGGGRGSMSDCFESAAPKVISDDGSFGQDARASPFPTRQAKMEIACESDSDEDGDSVLRAQPRNTLGIICSEDGEEHVREAKGQGENVEDAMEAQAGGA
jgi:hypothetical protein